MYKHKKEKTLGSKMHLFHKAVLANLMYCSILSFNSIATKQKYFNEMPKRDLKSLAERWGYKETNTKKKDYFNYMFKKDEHHTAGRYSYRQMATLPSLCAQGNKFLDRIIHNPYPLPNVISSHRRIWRPLHMTHAAPLQSNLKYQVTDVLTNFPDEDGDAFNLKRIKMQNYERKVYGNGIYNVHRGRDC
jgi:hypothetical protein